MLFFWHFYLPNVEKKWSLQKNVSEGSCDNEDWSNDAENPASRQINKLHQIYIQIENRIEKNEMKTLIFHITGFTQMFE